MRSAKAEIEDKCRGNDRQAHDRQNASSPGQQCRKAKGADRAGQQRRTAADCDQAGAAKGSPQSGTIGHHDLLAVLASSAG